MKTINRWGTAASLTASTALMLGLMMLPVTGQDGSPDPEGPDMCLLGDINGDGVIDLLDVGPFEDLLIDGNCAFQCAADVDQDGNVNLLDFCLFVDILNGGGS